ncbi:hypothetical protein H112_04682 [Trichophyton rubrum D6]|uniref:Uncharacterized protein n=3 Tax=Trichophyton TaxID=5550 RepID=F2SND6_TRIRC|nr:uncharacterized protein TERG_04447 [Trichophyton rubrum CBS 118892]EZF22482.1 hypothetical protein H100_04690 [Trichophyton rubrum MR850]EZF41357.1 hypothetical protein H102_04678 [Trichophyton rubrum CBS 100081]EZF52278.1 hypothetical protein H103_04683 [Trichophyton rubrum CBS 288.86]EZF62770.1 hypothetical protein H104_04669 [Trichophyton rubrum CBS 289.86]EZF73399.1 hypothetical protein H105_04699 [Trichophyton soudanense CBS 452.61]EZF84084.1 hypothetical protein H110_04679 [Trichophy
MFKAGYYCSINIDDVYSSYRALSELGYGLTSTVWLARNIRYGGYHALLKIFARGTTTGPARGNSERTMNQSHPRRTHVRRAVEMFPIERNGGKEHKFLVQAPLWDS